MNPGDRDRERERGPVELGVFGCSYHPWIHQARRGVPCEVSQPAGDKIVRIGEPCVVDLC